MTVKDIQKVISSATTIHLCVAKSVDEALSEKSQYRYTFNKYTNLSNCYGRLEVAYIYPECKDDLEVWAIED